MFLMTDLTKQAYLIACDAHFGQYDRCGRLYILHPMSVAEHFNDETLVAAALLHDVLEDNAEWTVARLYGRGMPPEVVRLVCILTRQKGESYFDYIRRVSQDEAATQIKLADLKHNTDVRRLDGLSDSLRARYNKAIKILKGQSVCDFEDACEAAKPLCSECNSKQFCVSLLDADLMSKCFWWDYLVAHADEIMKG